MKKQTTLLLLALVFSTYSAFAQQFVVTSSDLEEGQAPPPILFDYNDYRTQKFDPQLIQALQNYAAYPVEVNLYVPLTADPNYNQLVKYSVSIVLAKNELPVLETYEMQDQGVSYLRYSTVAMTPVQGYVIQQLVLAEQIGVESIGVGVAINYAKPRKKQIGFR